MVSLTPAERDALDEFVAAVRQRLGGAVVEMRLFGSRARGEGNEDSDVDVAVIVTQAGMERRREIHDLGFDAGLAHGVTLAPLVLPEERLAQLRARERRLAADLDREGIRL